MPYHDPRNQTPAETTNILTQLTRLGVAIDKELTLMGERMSWLNISESFIFSAFTLAVANHDKSIVLKIVAGLMPVVGFLLALFVYPALLAAHRTSMKLKEMRRQFELKLPEDLRVNLLASEREHFWGSVPAFVIPALLLLAWIVIIAALVYLPWHQSLAVPPGNS